MNDRGNTGENTGLCKPDCWCCLVPNSCLTVCDPVGFSPSASSVHGIPQARRLEWVATSFSRGSSWPRDQTHVSYIGKQFLYSWATRDGHDNQTAEPVALATIVLSSAKSLHLLIIWSVGLDRWVRSKWQQAPTFLCFSHINSDESEQPSKVCYLLWSGLVIQVYQDNMGLFQ